MSEVIGAVERFEQDLRAAGIERNAAIATVYHYIAALAEGSDATWHAFYRSVYDRLAELAARDYPIAGPAAEPLLRLLDDDLGSTLVSAADRARIRARLVEDRRSEASLPS